MSDGTYRGTQDAGSAVHEYNTADLHIQSAVSLVRTVLDVKVVRAPYDSGGNVIPSGTVGPIGFVDVQPLVNQLDGDGNSTPHGTVYRVPYHRYQSALGAVISDPVVGDIGELVVHDRDTSVVRATRAQGNPGSRRKHDLADGVYHGQHISGDTPSQYVALTSGGIKIADRNGNTIVMDASGITITSLGGAGPVRVHGNGGTITVNTHKHSGVLRGGGATDPPVPGS